MENVELVYAEARRKLDSQVEDVRSVRSRAAALLGVGGVISGLFGVQVTATPPSGRFHSAMVIIALTMFALSVVLTVGIEWPRKFYGDESLEPWLVSIKAGTAGDPRDFQFHMATASDTYRESNAPIYRRLVTMLTWMCALLGVQVIAWTLAVLA